MKIRQQSGRDLSHPAVIEKMLYLLEKRQSAFLDGSYSGNYAVSSLHHRPPEEGGGVLNNFIWGGSVRPEVQPLTLLYTIVKTVKGLNPGVISKVG